MNALLAVEVLEEVGDEDAVEVARPGSSADMISATTTRIPEPSTAAP